MAQYHSQRGREPTVKEAERLRTAIEQDDTNTIRKMIQEDSIDINSDISKKFFQQGFQQGINIRNVNDLQAFLLLMDTQATANDTNFFQGIQNQNINVNDLQALMDTQATADDTKDKDDSYTALHYAVKHDKLHCVKLLVQLGADVTINDKDWDDLNGIRNHKIPLERAVDKNRSSIVYYFVKDYNQKISTLDQDYQQRIHVMIEQHERQATQQKLREQTEQLTITPKSRNELPGGQLQELKAQVQSLQRSVEQLQQGLTTEQQKSSSLETRLSAEERKSAALERRCESLETSLATEKQKSQTLEARCNSQEERLRTVEDTVERLWAISRDEITLSNKILGTGGWGYVTEATFRGRQVAAKCLHEAIISPHNQELFAKEMKISARCRHKNLVEFIGAVPDHPAIIVIEMMDCTLRFVLSNGRVIPNHIHQVCIDVAQGLVYLHSIQPHPLIHRDVSAPNVLLKAVGTGWRAKLSDLGSAQFANIAQTLAPGCVLYAAPEVQQRDTALKQTEKVDVYSYGVLLIEILTREMPTGVLSQLISSLQPTRPQFIPLIQRCTNTDPSRRPAMKEVISLVNTLNI